MICAAVSIFSCLLLIATGCNTTLYGSSSYSVSQRVYFENGCSFVFDSDWALVSGRISNVNGRSIAKNVRYNTEVVCKYDKFADGSIEINAAIGLLPYEINCHKGLPSSLKKHFPTTQAEAKRIPESSLKELKSHYKKETKSDFDRHNRKDFEYIEFQKIEISDYYGLASRFRFTHSNDVTYDVTVVMIPLDGHLTGFYWMHPETLGKTYSYVPILHKREDLHSVLAKLKVTRLSIVN